jgi:hypothetical protein
MSANTAAWETPEQVNLNDAHATGLNPFRSPSPHLADVAFCVRRAVEMHSSHKECADAIGQDYGYWNRILANGRGIKLSQLGLLPVAVQREIVRGWAGVLGLQIERKGDAAKRVALEKFIEAGHALAECL